VPLQLSTPVKFVKRIGDRIAAGLADRGVSTIEDLLYHLPFRYEDRLHPKPLSLYHPGDMASLIGEVRGTVLLRTRSSPIFEMTVGITPPDPNPTTNPGTNPGAPGLASETWVSTDPSMAGLLQPSLASRPSRLASPLETVKCMWFHGAYLKDKFRPGQKIALYGKLEGSRSGNALNAPPGSTRFKMIQPTFEILPDSTATGDDAEFTMLEMGRIVPVYESLGSKTPWGSKLTSRWLRRVMWTIFKDLTESSETTDPSETMGAPRLDSETWASTEASTPHQPHPASRISNLESRISHLASRISNLPSRISNLASRISPDETLPTSLRTRLHFPTRMESLRDLHFPPAGTSMTELMSARTPAHRRLIFEEFFYLELGLELKRRRLRERQGTAFVTNDQVREALKQVLPFKPTAAQKRVLGEIVQDMRRPQPMRRLLQGDVGSGKTIVAFQAALIAIENGYQVALMAPTEILATQHYLSARKLLSEKISPRTKRPYRIALLTGSLDDRTKRDTRARIFRGEVDLAIGTHALVEEKVDFANLGLVIVDEQHRFGVQQRFQLTRKNSGTTNSGAPSSTGSLIAGQGGVEEAAAVSDPDVLVMTATPIPRTLALTLYGDLEASIIDELPPGRTPIQTRRMTEDRSHEVWDFVRKQVAAGRQAYIVYPIIEGTPSDQPELDFAHYAEDTSQQSTSSETGEPAPAPSAEGAPYTSVGQSPTKASKVNQRAGGPTYKPATKARAKAAANRQPLRSATEMHAELQQGPLSGLKLGLLHGRMSADDKEVTMARFKRGEIDVLVATTVIEVGVDVPNATVMVIEHADRFGLAQLHQLRGRVGRGAAKSYCVLIAAPTITPEAEQRLNAMVQTQDGFALAELDLQQRGPGEFFGTKQAGLPEFRVANLARDRDLLELAKQEATNFVQTPDPTIPRPEIEAVWSRLKQQWQRRYGLVEA
jgi:ATP-dependent DNA helicase RecG